MVMSLLDRLPVIGDKLNWQEWSMTVVEVEERRVTRVLLRKKWFGEQGCICGLVFSGNDSSLRQSRLW